MIEVFTSKYCAPCKILKKFLSELNIKYIEVNIDSPDGMERFMKLKTNAIPVMRFRNGKLFIGCPRKKEDLIKVLRENGEKVSL